MQKILIVDDEPDLKDILVHNFKAEQWDALGAESALEALELINTFKPDVIISDITMPGMTGLQMLEILENQNSNTPVIFLTGYSDLQKVRDAWLFGAFDLVDKPFIIANLMQIADNALRFGVEYVQSSRKRRLRLKKSA